MHTAFWLYNREAELVRLIKWAKQKRLTGPHRLYEWRLLDTQAGLQRIRFRSPRAAAWAEMGHGLVEIIFSPPKYRPKGSAAGYRRA